MATMKKHNFYKCIIFFLLIILIAFNGCSTDRPTQTLPFLKKKALILTLPSVKERSFSLHSLRGKRTFVLFFATWCRPCQILFNRLLRAQAFFEKDKPAIVAISVDQDPRFLKVFAETLNLPFPVLHATPEALDSAAIGRIQSVPTLLLIDKKGIPRALLSRLLSTRELVELIKRL